MIVNPIIVKRFSEDAVKAYGLLSAPEAKKEAEEAESEIAMKIIDNLRQSIRSAASKNQFSAYYCTDFAINSSIVLLIKAVFEERGYKINVHPSQSSITITVDFSGS